MAALLTGSALGNGIVSFNGRGLGFLDTLVLLLWLTLISMAFAGAFYLAAAVAERVIPLLRPKLRPDRTTLFITVYILFMTWIYVVRTYLYDLPIGPGRAAQTVGQAKALFWGGNIALAAFFIGAGFLALKIFPDRADRPSNLSGVVKAALLAVWIAAAVAMFIPAKQPVSNSGKVSPPSSRNRDGKLFIIAVDGADWGIINHLAGRGRLPNFKSFIEQGAAGSLQTFWPTLSPLIWTSAFTGKLPSQHGVIDFGVFRFPGMSRGFYRGFGLRRLFGLLHDLQLVEMTIINHTFGNEPKLWDIMTAFKRESVVSGPLMTWPAPNIKGSFVADQLYEKLKMDEKLDPGGNMEGYVYPPSTAERLFSGFEYEDLVRNRDVLFSSLFLRQLELVPKADLALVYLRHVDLVCHVNLCWDGQCYPEGERAERVDDAYVYVDNFLGEVRGLIGPDTSVMIISDHGFEPYLMAGGLCGHHRFFPEGVFILQGPGIKAGHWMEEGAHVLDISPTALHLLGIPVSEDMAGEVMEDAFIERPLVSRVNNYDWVPRNRARAKVDPGTDKRIIEELKALGYVQ
jgi:hypothetical protein